VEEGRDALVGALLPAVQSPNSLYSTWDRQLYPDGLPGAMVMANANPNGGLELANNYWVSFPDGYSAHQIRLEGGDCSTDSFCYPSA
jgi:selenium-binding protein 1